ncbi:hypothetical protein [Microbacterium sp.]|uniref:hypothetical protein n=1 Tax=Microbacterium sp. TaxID=51671 RepID=UPI0039E692BE
MIGFAKIVAKSEPHVLELRVHGVNNTAPQDLLDLPKDQVELAAGDELGSFWRPTAAASGPSTRPRGAIPPGIVREAYSWGGMVRTTPGVGGTGVAGKILAVIARIGYALLLPFALANTVQWVRRLKLPDPEQVAVDEATASALSEAAAGKNGQAGASGAPGAPGATAPRPRRNAIPMTAQERALSLLSERGHLLAAGATRVFGLLLTLVFTTTAATVGLGIGAAQCAARSTLCGPLAGVFAPLEDATPGQRFGLLGLVPVAAIVVLWGLSAISRQRYGSRPSMASHTERPTPKDRLERAPQASRALLGQRGFWSTRGSRDLARLNLAGGLLLSAGFVSVHAAASDWGRDWAGWHVACAWIVLAGLVVTAALTFAVPTTTVLPIGSAGSRWPSRASAAMLIAACAVAAAILLVIAFEPYAGEPADVPPTPLTWANEVLLVLVALATAIALTGCGWRRADRARRSYRAWRGRAPAVFMMLALAVAVGTSAIVVATTGNVLNGSASSSQLVDPDVAPAPVTTAPALVPEGFESIGQAEIVTPSGQADGATLVVPTPVDPRPVSLQVPTGFLALGTTILAGGLAALLILGLFLLPRRDVSPRAARWQQTWKPGEPRVGPFAELDSDDGVLPLDPVDLYAQITSTRAAAARFHLVEPVLGMLSVFFGLAIVLGIVWTIAGSGAFGAPGAFPARLWPVENGLAPGAMHRILDIAIAALSFAGLALVAALAADVQRPLGIVWDVVCYLPRTGQPFGPPCYAERAVPEIAGRMYAWLNDRDNDPRRRRTVVLAAHSMGAVLSVSALALLASTGKGDELLGRIRLLTFGVQLRAYFGRVLPELLGPEVLGIQSCLAPRLRSRDPWQADADAAPAADDTASGTLTGTLLPEPGVPWRSLWRLTDYLGFPARAPRENPVDRYAQELDLTGYMIAIGTHGDYYRSRAYETALLELRDLNPRDMN